MKIRTLLLLQLQQIEKPYLDEEGAFDVQRIATVASVRLERKLGELSRAELNSVLDRLAERLGW